MAFFKPRQWLKILLLTAFAYWATGLAQYLHERIEHHHGVMATTVLPPGLHAEKTGTPKQAPQPDDRDDCVTCQSLKVMKAQPAAGPVLMPQPTLLRHEKLPIVHREAPVLSFVVFIAARAPPVAADLASA
jgi:hypothetical protein